MTKQKTIKCDNCNKNAEYNLQNWWHFYKSHKSYIKRTSISEDEQYKKIDDWEGDVNHFWCKEHAKEETGYDTATLRKLPEV